MNYAETSYGELLNKLGTSREWYEHVLGCSLDDTRLDAAQEAIAKIIEIGEDLERRSDPFRHIDELTAYYALTTGLGFSKIADGLGALGDHQLPRGLIKRALQGELSPAEETQTTADARNIFGQLELAADLRLNGIEILGFEDVEFDFEGVRYLVEVKRPWSDANTSVDNVIRTAESQLRRELDARGHSARGLIALEVDKISGLNSSLPTDYPVRGPDDVLGYTRTLAFAFKEAYGPLFAGLDPRLNGLLLIARLLVHTIADNSFGPVYVPTFMPLNERGSADRERFRRLGGRLVAHSNGQDD